MFTPFSLLAGSSDIHREGVEGKNYYMTNNNTSDFQLISRTLRKI
jgi:hypothetical protein